MLNIVWFKRDLRIQDHAALAAAAAAGPILPIYVAEPGFWAQPDASARQWAFAAECLAELQRDLSYLGLPLRIFTGDVIEILRSLKEKHRVTALWSQEETGNNWTYARDKRVSAWAGETGVVWHELRQTGAVRRIKSRDGWARQWDADMALPQTPARLKGPQGNWPVADPGCARTWSDPRSLPRASTRRTVGWATNLAQLSDQTWAGLPVRDVQPDHRL